MTDRIEIRGVRAIGRHGVLEHEKRVPAPFVVDVELEVDLSAAGGSDDLADTVSYADVAADVVRVVEGESVALVERLAELIAAQALTRPLVEVARVTVHKPAAPVGVSFDDVAVRITREADRSFVLALGGNVGDVAATFTRALDRVDALDGVRLARVSPLVETDPVGGPEQPDFLNAVATGRTRRHPAGLLRELRRIESDLGRRRDVRWGPRTLDLDLVQVGDPDTGEFVVESETLTLPHPRAHERAFVLHPWSVVDPRARLRTPDGAVADVARLAERAPDAAGLRPGPAWAWPGRT